MSGLAVLGDAVARHGPEAAHPGTSVWLLPESRVEELTAAAPPERVLSGDEHARIRRLHTPQARRRALGARLLARLLLAREAGVTPSELSFVSGPYGRPELAPNPWRLRFNLSHSEGWIACVITRGVPCGVDVQRPMEADVVHHLTAALSERERAALSALDPRRRAEALMDIWAVKEAYTKALGTGLRYGFRSLTVEGVPGGPVLLRDGRLAVRRSWQFRLERLHTGHSLAVAVRRSGTASRSIVIRQFPEGALT